MKTWVSFTAQHRLGNLRDELAATENQISIATEELQSLVDAKPSRHLTEDDKQEIRNLLASKMSKVTKHGFQNERFRRVILSWKTELPKMYKIIVSF